jgi:hypothetical protein
MSLQTSARAHNLIVSAGGSIAHPYTFFVFSGPYKDPGKIDILVDHEDKKAL